MPIARRRPTARRPVRRPPVAGAHVPAGVLEVARRGDQRELDLRHVQRRSSASSSATVPVTCGAAIDVPLLRSVVLIPRNDGTTLTSRLREHRLAVLLGHRDHDRPVVHEVSGWNRQPRLTSQSPRRIPATEASGRGVVVVPRMTALAAPASLRVARLSPEQRLFRAAHRCATLPWRRAGRSLPAAIAAIDDLAR